MDTEQTLVIEDDSSEDLQREVRRKDKGSQDFGKVQIRGKQVIAPVSKGLIVSERQFLSKPKTKHLLPLPLIPTSRVRRTHSHRTDQRRKPVDPAELEYNQRTDIRTSSRTEDSFEDEGRMGLRKKFQAWFPVTERVIPAYDSLTDKHVRFHAKFRRFQRPFPILSRSSNRKKAFLTDTDSNYYKDLHLPKMSRKGSGSTSRKGLQWAYRDDLMKGRDWGRSVLDGYASQGVWIFNPERSPNIFTEEEMTQLLETLKDRTANINDIERMVAKGGLTLERLKAELLLPEDSGQLPVSKDTLLTLLLQCHSHLQTRQLVLQILSAIHKREASQLTLLHPAPSSSSYRDFLAQSHSILSNAARFKALSGDPGFLYLGTEYVRKIYSDTEHLPDAWKGRLDC